MHSWVRLLRSIAAITLLLALIFQGTSVLAGTTGALSGTVTDQSTNKPLAGVKVTVSSPSQSSSTISDGSGHFVFLFLSPDSYTVSAESTGFEPASQSGVTIQADQTLTQTIVLQPSLKIVGRVTTRPATSLVRPGTTADVYSVDATAQEKAGAIGGGGNLSSAWSALATVPGVFIAPGQSGYIGAASTLSIRGGDYDQIGYEVDGVPVNRAFDNYPSGPASSLGQQTLEVYTGAAPANAEAQGISGFINQVIRTGTYPGFATATVGLGGPSFYHKLAVEVGGASPNRNFSYYVGIGGYNQSTRVADQFNGSGLSSIYGVPLAPCAYPPDATTPAPSCLTNGVPNNNTGPGSFILAPYNAFAGSDVASRDSVVNLHFGIPHKNGTRDDVQLLFVNDSLRSQFYNSTNDLGGAAFLNDSGYGIPSYTDGYAYAGATGVPLPANAQALTSIYYYPQSNSAGRAPGDPIPAGARDAFVNNQSIFKLQYARALGSRALLKVYGYTYYSDWLNLGPQDAYANYFGQVSPDYVLASHTRGVSATLTDQINSNHLLSLQGSYTTASTLRSNNTQFYDGSGNVGARSVFAALVDSSNPTNGICYATGGIATTCSLANISTDPAVVATSANFLTLKQAYNGTITPASGTCGGGPCEYLVLANGQYATYNTVKPKFSAFSLTDQWRPTSKLTVDGGLRFDRYQYDGANTSGTAARAFWYTAFNLDTCLDANNNLFDKVNDLGLASPTIPCPAGYTAANFQNPNGLVTEAYNVWQPRLGFTYTLNPRTVVRASYGRYAQAPNSAFQQYDALQQNAPYLLYSTYGFQKFGFTSPNHSVVPPTSNNFDVSLEHQFKNDVSVKLTPFLRKTQNQIQQFFLNQQTGFVSGLNVGNQTSQGFELAVDKGNFNRNGIAARASFTYTNSYIRYTKLSNGSSIIDPLNTEIVNYNGYTSHCAANPADKACATAASHVAAAPCYTTAGAADPSCAAGSIANPYWNAPVQGLLDPNGNYPAYDIFPAGIGSSVAGYGAPYVGTLIVQYKHDKFAVTPALQFFAGQRYGAPLTTLGINPATCTAALGSPTGDARYPYGAAGGSAYDWTSCGQLAGIPDTYTGKFDSLGAFVAPTQLQLHLQLSYDVNPQVQLQATFANLVNTCFGGTKNGFTQSGACAYTVVANGATGGVGNTYNPGSAIQPYVQAPYLPAYASGPLSIFLQAKIKL
jgi:outer membrane receptor protein involved in Fe transport